MYSEDYEGPAFGDEDAHGWQVLPYSSTKNWPCDEEEADSILVRGARFKPEEGAGHISAHEARRMARALMVLANKIEKKGSGDV